jgi:hypothetical protein
MVAKKKTSKKGSKKNVSKVYSKTKPKSNKQKKFSKETVRVKTFIVEKPVYVETPLIRKEPPAKSRHPDYFQVLDARKSRYAKGESVEEEPLYSEKEQSLEEDSDYSEEDFNEFPQENNFDEDNSESIDEFGESVENTKQKEKIDLTESGHPRSRAIFSGTWWKRAFWQAVAIWIAIFIFAFFMDLINLSQVELQRNWVFLFVGIFLIMLVYQKFLKGKIII